ncbi:cytosolic Fe-S cluster assembly factor NUBP1 homolog [Oppia nitens]|uniref:cytosolic Fe-S cluster assembly factor NUBP1 homolog n=1 Tax=Oppia nitens TaxID=1686743 RepID=UPI0023D98084|nr:cytosolic Fe-S cluster assembly factor NUBP1 homolog [Oppia nitens]
MFVVKSMIFIDNCLLKRSDPVIDTMEVPPNHCPGIESSNAGKVDACEGCPNRGLCASGEAKTGPDPVVTEIADRLKTIKHIVLVMSGKGGVGKSTVSTLLARYLAKDKTINVGLLDIDICGPSIPKTMGVEGEEVHQSMSGWSPIYVTDNLSVMSCGFLLGSADDAVIWRGPKKNTIIKQFLNDVDWDQLEYLVVDTPPGTSDEHLSVVSYLKKCSNLKGVIIVTTPQEVALMDVRKQIDFCERVGLKVLGVIQNMTTFFCPNCSKESTIFKHSKNGMQALLEKEIPVLGTLPLDPLIGKSCDEAIDMFEDNQSKTIKNFEIIGNKLIEILNKSNTD